MIELAAREARAVWAAAMFFTRLPLPSLPVLLPEDEQRATGWWPLIGIGVGAVIAGVWWLAAHVLPGSVAVGLALAAGILFTGAMHEDGFADVCDGFGGGRTRERVLEIMRDSRVGAYGAVGIVMLLGLKWQAMTALRPVLLPGVVIAAHALSRGAALAMTAALPYARTDGRPAQRMTEVSGARLAAGALVALAPLLLVPPAARVACLAVTAATWVACLLWFRHRLDGYTGDCLGAVQQITETAILMAALATL
jgi:adenosylcobinamide-GDP ribazoletransferase